MVWTTLKLFSVVLLAPAIFCQSSLPNIVVIIADDLDSELGGDVPLVKAYDWIQNNGVTFINAFVPVSVCCPSRASMLTGMYQHNHGVLNNSVAGDCCGETWRQTTETRTYASYLKGAGYVTFFSGKYLNEYGLEYAGGIEHVPAGWDYWASLVGNSVYYDYDLSINGVQESHGSVYEDDYLTDVIGRKANSFLDFYFNQIGANSPFLMVLSPPAPHAPYVTAPQYGQNYADYQAPRTPAFNFVDDDKHWLLNAPGPRPLDDSLVEVVDEIYRDRLRTMLSVDDLIDDVIQRIDSAGVLDNTFVIFVSDHGYHLGQFGMAREKRLPYDFDLRIPLSVRGPGVREGITEDAVVTVVDLAPTILEIAGLSPPADMDGTSFLPWLINVDEVISPVSRTSFLVSLHGEGGAQNSAPCEGMFDTTYLTNCDFGFNCQCYDAKNNTYQCLRTLSNEENTLFCQFEDDVAFQEFYDLDLDPYQLINLANDLDGTEKSSYIDKIMSLFGCSGSQECFQA